MKNLPFSWFDIVVLALLIFGLIRGKKHGMSNELLPLLQWLMIIYVAGTFHEPLGKFLASVTAGLGFSFLFWYITAYLVIVLAVKTVFSVIKKAVGEKLVGSDLFGGGEFYLGMFAGMIRFACMLIMFFALLDSKPLPSEARVVEKQKKQQESLGSNFFPSLDAVHLDIMSHSASGQFVTKYLKQLLIAPTSSESKPLERREGPGKKIEREMNDVIDKKR